jgi:hypothetical protein
MMNIKQAVELLKAKAETKEEKYALALLVCELDTQFCYGWGAACTASEEALFDALSKQREIGEGLPFGNIHLDVFMAVAGSPSLENFRDDFPGMEEFSKMRDELSKAFENADEFPF